MFIGGVCGGVGMTKQQNGTKEEQTKCFEIEVMTCAHCGEEVKGDIFQWTITHNCRGGEK